jgi:signal transduction histidine kinase
MNGVIAVASLLRQTELDKSRGARWKRFERAEVLLNILNDILDYSKIEAEIRARTSSLQFEKMCGGDLI